MKILFVGDPHATPESLPDVQAVLNYAENLAETYDVQALCILGDLFHTHSTVNLQVLDFWRRWFDKERSFPVYVLVGNHDQAGKTNEGLNVLQQINGSGKVEIVDRPRVFKGIEFRPYMHSIQDFEALPGKSDILVCHATFQGAQYENGFYVKPEDAVNPDNLPHKTIISGHIHKPGQVGKVYYVGSSRWVTQSDANQVKSLTIATIKDTVEYEHFPIHTVIKPIVQLDWKEGEPKPKLPRHGTAKTTIHLHGSQEWITQAKTELEEVAVRAFPVRQSRFQLKASESVGVEQSFRNYVEQFSKSKGLESEEILSVIHQAMESKNV